MKRILWFSLLGLLLAALLLPACTATPGGATKIRVATDATWPPFEYVNEQTKQIEGFDIDLLNGVAKKAGLEVEYINVGFDPLLAGIAQCQYDAAISSITITEDRAKEMLFSDPYFAAGQIVTVRLDETAIKSKDNLSGKTVGAQIGTTGAIEIGKIPGATLKTYDDIGLAFQDLMNKQIDAVVADNPLALGYVGENEDKLKTAGNIFTEENYGIAICKSKADLVSKINAGLKAVKKDGLIDELTKKWLQ
jgi:ABC-type amino acid transport substrate-binding protein